MNKGAYFIHLRVTSLILHIKARFQVLGSNPKLPPVMSLESVSHRAEGKFAKKILTVKKKSLDLNHLKEV